MGLGPELRIDFTPQITIHFMFPVRKKTTPPVCIAFAPDVSQEQKRLYESIKKRAQVIAKNVRTLGEPKYGPMWKQGYTVLPDNRKVFLQQQQSPDKHVGETLEVVIPYDPDTQHSIHLRYDLKRNSICTYERRWVNGRPIFAYGIDNQPVQGTRATVNLNFCENYSQIDMLLQLIEAASSKIIWEKPDPATTIPPDKYLRTIYSF